MHRNEGGDLNARLKSAQNSRGGRNVTLSEAIGSLGCRRNSSSGSMLIRQLTEPQLLTCSRIGHLAGNSVQ